MPIFLYYSHELKDITMRINQLTRKGELTTEVKHGNVCIFAK